MIVFDFDGTLVDTASIKRQAFFDVLPAECHDAVEAVLTTDPDGSRHSVIPAMLDEAVRRGVNVSELDAGTVVAAYSDAVRNAVRNAPDVDGVRGALDWAANLGSVYIFSMTPETELAGAVATRSWCGCILETFGYPASKEDVLACLIERHSAEPEEVLVVGDGHSDREAAAAHGCDFYHISPDRPLAAVTVFGGTG